MTKREARAIALRNIVDGISSDWANGSAYWAQHPKTHADLSDEDAEKVEKEARAILHALDARARRAGQ